MAENLLVSAVSCLSFRAGLLRREHIHTMKPDYKEHLTKYDKWFLIQVDCNTGFTN